MIMKKLLTLLCMALLPGTFIFAQDSSSNYAQEFGTANGDGRSWTNTVFQTTTDGTKTVNVNFDTSGKNSYTIFSDELATEGNKITVLRGETFNITINGGLNWMYTMVYIDWNADGSFDETTEKIGILPSIERSFNNGTAEGSSASRTHTVAVPEDATITENTRIRILIGWYRTLDDSGNSLPEDQWENWSSTTIDQKKNAMVRDFALAIKDNTIDPRTITVISTDEEMGTVSIEGTTEQSITTNDLNVTVTATPNEGYMFIDWVNAEGTTVSTSATYIYSGLTDITLIARFTEKTYPAMKRKYEAVNQQNRYLKEVVATVGGQEQTVFSATTQNDLPYTNYVTAGETTTSGALIDKTGNPILVPVNTASFDLTFKAWAESINGYNTELVWTQQACYIDWNDDKDFDDAGEIMEAVGTTGNNNNFGDANGSLANGWTRSFTVPEGTVAGDYRLRVVYSQGGGVNGWENTLFTTGGALIINGISYDFTIRIQSSGNPTALETVATLQAYYSASSESIVCGQPARITVYDMAGKMLLNGDNVSQLSVATLNQGVYIANVNGQPFKFVK